MADQPRNYNLKDLYNVRHFYQQCSPNAEHQSVLCRPCETESNEESHFEAHSRTTEETFKDSTYEKNFAPVNENTHSESYPRIRPEEKALNCNTHEQSFSNYLNTHLTHVCPICKREFSLICLLNIHLHTHSDIEKPLNYSVPTKGISLISSLGNHSVTYTGEAPFICNVCKKEFCEQNDLEKHISTHREEKSFVCSICSEEFSRKNTLITHLQTHPGENLFVCSVCNKGFSQKDKFNIHLRTHTEEKPLVSSEYDKVFSQKDTLNTHLDSNKEAPFFCSICNRFFSEQNSLETHLCTPTGENLFVC